MQEWGIVNAVVAHEKLIPTALSYARKICQNSPDAVIVSRTGMLMSLERITPAKSPHPIKNTLPPQAIARFPLVYFSFPFPLMSFIVLKMLWTGENLIYRWQCGEGDAITQ